MKTLILSLILAASAFGQTVSNVTFDGIGNGEARVIFDVSGTYTDKRVRWIASPGTCTAGTGGFVQYAQALVPLYASTANITGLTANTLYNACPEVKNGGGAWSTGVSASFTTANDDGLPIAPATVPTTYGAQSGTNRTVAADCSDLQAKIDLSVPGDTVTVPAGTVCSSTYTLPNPTPALVKTFATTDIRTSDSRLTWTSHGLSEGAQLVMSTAGYPSNCLPGMRIFPYGNNCDLGGGWGKGKRYTAHVVDANNIQIYDGGAPVIPGWATVTADPTTDTFLLTPKVTTPAGYAAGASNSTIPANTTFQLHCATTCPAGLAQDTTYYWLTSCSGGSASTACISQISASSGGAAINFTTAGSSTLTLVDQGLGTMYVMPEPAAPGTAGADVLLTTGGSLPPAGTRVSSADAAQMFYFRKTTVGGDTRNLLAGVFAHNWHIVGAQFDAGTSGNTDYTTQADPTPYCIGWKTFPDSSSIIFDRYRLIGPDYPQRTGCSTNANSVYWDGYNVGIINSDGHTNYWHAYVPSSGWGGSNTTTVWTIPAGTISTGASYSGVVTPSGSSTITLTSGGSVTDTYGAFLTLGVDGHFKLTPKTGTTWTCVVPGYTCDVLSTSANSDWPMSGGRWSGFRIGYVSLSAGAISGTCNPRTCQDMVNSASATEGSNTYIAGNGPGPYIYHNNSSASAGLFLHFDDSGGPLLPRGDYTITNNLFDVPAALQATSASTNGLNYSHRQPLEWKGGQRQYIANNVFTGCYAQNNPWGVCLAETARSGGTITDVDLYNNRAGCFDGTTACSVSGAWQLPIAIDAIHPTSKPPVRIRARNNLAVLNAYDHTVNSGGTLGICFQTGYGAGSVTIDHNTCYNTRASNGAFLWASQTPAAGVSVTNNVYFYTGAGTGSGNMFYSENVADGTAGGYCNSLSDALTLACVYKPSRTFTTNLVIGSYTNPSAGTGVVLQSTLNTTFTGYTASNSIYSGGASWAANVAYVNFKATLDLAAASPYYAAGSSATPIGYYDVSSTDILKSKLNLSKVKLGGSYKLK